MLNVYSDSSQLALKYLKNTKININNVFIITDDFNIRESLADPLFLYHLIHSDTLTDITNSFQLYISSPTVQISTRHTDNHNNANLVMDLMFFRPISEEFNHYFIHMD